MKIVDDFEKIKNLPYPVLTIGNFDGVHLGHQALFQLVINRAREMKGTSIVYTFVPHPLRVIAPERAPKMITTYKEKIRLIEQSGIDLIICTHFTKSFANLSAEDFTREILCNTLHIKEIFIGSNYLFGKGRKGTPDLLKRFGRRCGFKVNIIDEIKIDNVIVSSSKIRNLIAKGRVDEASKLLGRNYSIEGIVVEGTKRGSSLLKFPTANLLTPNELIPKDGVYAVTVEIGEKTYIGATNIGFNPTFPDKRFSIETHILDFNGNLMGKTLRLNFIKRIRDEIKFSSVGELANQIKTDIEMIRQIVQEIFISTQA